MEVIAAKTLQNSFDLRFGSRFFEHIPKQPGVYWFRNRKGHVIHLKRAHNLRKKILSYKMVHPIRQTPELQRLLTHVAYVQWAPSASLEASLLLEKNIRDDLKKACEAPGRSPQNSLYFGFSFQHRDVYFRMGLDPSSLQGYHVFGPFKGRIKMQRQLASLLRLMWYADRGLGSSLASPLVKLMAPPVFHFQLQNISTLYPEKFMSFLNGFHPEWLKTIGLETDTQTPSSELNFNLNWYMQDLQTTEDFFEKNLRKAYIFRQRYALETDADPLEPWDTLIAMTPEALKSSTVY